MKHLIFKKMERKATSKQLETLKKKISKMKFKCLLNRLELNQKKNKKLSQVSVQNERKRKKVKFNLKKLFLKKNHVIHRKLESILPLVILQQLLLPIISLKIFKNCFMRKNKPNSNTQKL